MSEISQKPFQVDHLPTVSEKFQIPDSGEISNSDSGEARDFGEISEVVVMKMKFASS